MAKGIKHPYQLSVSGHITLQWAIAAARKVITPLVIFSKDLPRSWYADGIPDEQSFAFSDSGYINNDLFQSWYSDCFVKQCGKARPISVVVDNHVTHLNKCKIDLAHREHIELLCLPASQLTYYSPLTLVSIIS